jgi:hypothetical protein
VSNLIMRVVLALCLNFAAMAQIRLPAPTGPYPIGRQMLLWRDSARLEDVGPQSGKPREVAAYIFYPATASGAHAEYYPGLAGLENAPETRLLRLQFGAAWNAVTTGTIQTNLYAAPPMPSGSARFPVLIFSPGGMAPVLGYQLQLEELASRGYIIFALEHGTDSALIIRPDGTLLSYFSRGPSGNGPPTTARLEADREQVIRRTEDVIFALDQIAALGGRADSIFHNRLDLARIGVFGHSEGGKAALRACQLDSRIRTCLNQDGEMFNQPLDPPESVPTVLPGKPTLAPVADIFVNEPGFTDAQLAAVKVTRKQFEDWRGAKNGALRSFLRQNTQDSFLITISAPGYVHGSFMDMRLLSISPTPESATNFKTGIALTSDFFNHYLHWGDEAGWQRFTATPIEGIRIERLDSKR